MAPTTPQRQVGPVLASNAMGHRAFVLLAFGVCAPALACTTSPPPSVASSSPPAAETTITEPPAAGTCTTAQALEITLASNAGLVVRSGETSVLVDVIYGESFPGFTINSPQQREAIDQGAAPFDDVDVVLATHHHADHFDAEMVGAYLMRYPAVHFVSTQAAVDLVLATLPVDHGADGRLHGYGFEQGSASVEHLELGAVGIDIVELRHVGDQPTPNVGFVVELGGQRVLHVGDTLVAGEAFPIAALGRIDVALMPYWYLLDETSATFLGTVLDPPHLVPMHLPAIPEDEAGQAEYRELRQSIEDQFAATRWLDQPNQSESVCPS